MRSRSFPAVEEGIGRSEPEDSCWWITFSLDHSHPLVWHVIQRLEHVLNSITLKERLDVVFRPVSPPPDLNGGPEHPSWVIEATKRFVNPETARKVLRAQLPATLSSEKQWREFDTEE